MAALLGSCLLLPAITAGADATSSSDLELWLEGSLDLHVAKRVFVGLEQHLRLDDDAARLDALMTEVSPSYRLGKHVRFEAGYRFIYGRDGADGDLETWHRFFGGVRLAASYRPLGLDLRLRAQEQLRFEGENQQEHSARARVRLRYELGATSLRTSYELFTRFGDAQGLRAQKWRVFLGAEHDLGDVTLGAAVGRESFFDSDRSAWIGIVSVGAQ